MSIKKKLMYAELIVLFSLMLLWIGWDNVKMRWGHFKHRKERRDNIAKHKLWKFTASLLYDKEIW